MASRTAGLPAERRVRAPPLDQGFPSLPAELPRVGAGGRPPGAWVRGQGGSGRRGGRGACPGRGGGQPHTETVVEGVEILLALGPGAPGPQSGSGLGLDVGAAGAGSSVTLVVLVAPDDEGRLAYARAFADLEVAIVPT